MWSAVATSLVIFTSTVMADTDNAQMRNLENRMNALEQRKGASGMINPPGRPQVRDGADLFLFGDLFYWNAHENGLPVAVINEGSDVNLSDADAKVIHSDWDFGFRLGVGYNLPHDGWDVNLTWLRFHTHGHKRVHADSDEFIFPTRAHAGDLINTVCDKSHSHWKLHLNQLDLDLGREFFVSKWVTLRPHFGLRTDWIYQKWDTDYRNFTGIATPNEIEAEYKDNWWGMGLEAGLDTQWGLGGGWSLFGNMTGAILYGFHDMNYEDEVSPPQDYTNSKGKFADVDFSYRVSHPVLDLMMGLRYDCMFSDDRFHFGIEAGWEHHIYFSQNQFPVFVDDASLGDFVTNQGDLTFQGWTIAARFDF
jgi:hypothetical protein